jgi:hypothetical protein
MLAELVALVEAEAEGLHMLEVQQHQDKVIMVEVQMYHCLAVVAAVVQVLSVPLVHLLQVLMVVMEPHLLYLVLQ